MNCPAVRDRLPEHALGVADHHDVHAIERHLAWCAACRKEARDLERAAATLAFAPAPAAPPRELEERIVAAARRDRPSPPMTKPGRGRRFGVVLIAAALTIAGLGAGAVLGRRDAPPPGKPSTQAQQQDAAFERFQRIIQSAGPDTKAAVGLLTPSGKVPWRGAALVIVSPSGDDQVVVTVDGLPRARAPYRIAITDGHGHAVPVAVIRHLDKEGGAMKGRVIARDLTKYVRVVVTDAQGRTVLTGVLDPAPPAG
ncbi:MAG: zf-HC2 domain-containing protein [Actinobacteria bacterium]|nr:MAG: zf-HC2 domain-containing protein [Actinomycetota bacterium]